MIFIQYKGIYAEIGPIREEVTSKDSRYLANKQSEEIRRTHFTNSMAASMFQMLASQARRVGGCTIINHCTHRVSILQLPSSSPLIPRTSLRTLSSTTQTSSRPFKILGLQQIAIGSLDKSLLSNLWTNIFGIPKIGNYKSEKENVDEDILVLGKEDSPLAVEVDLMMPIDAEKSPKVNVPPLNHIGLWVDDLPAAVSWMENEGVRFTPGGVSI